MRSGICVWAVVILALLTMSACSVTPDVTSSAQRPPSVTECPLTAKLVPTCGVLMGLTAPKPSQTAFAAAEASVNHSISMFFRFHDINDVVPDREDRSVSRRGAVLRLTIESRDYASMDRGSVTWAEIAAGKYDASLTAQARGLAALNQPTFVTFSHEPDQPDRRILGTPTDYIAAWRHVHDLFDRAGARRAVWVWVVTGWPGSYERALDLWPGNQYVDWTGWEAYNKAGCTSNGFQPNRWRTFEQVAMPFYRWFWQHGPARGIETSKPMMLSEVGTVQDPSRPRAAAQWFGQVPSILRRFPQIKAVTIWDHVGTGQDCDYRFSHSPGVAAAVSRLAQDPYMQHSREDE